MEDCPRIYHYSKLVKELNLIDQVANKLGIKPSSLRRQINRIEAFYENRLSQKRSGKGKEREYIQAMREVLENNLGRPVFVCPFNTERKIYFDRLMDALAYSYPIAHISTLAYDWRLKKWVVYISKSSELPFSEWDY
jgi:hypothetical protein